MTKYELFETSKKDGNLHVVIRLAHHTGIEGDPPRIVLSRDDVEEILKSKRIKHGKCLTPNNRLLSWKENVREMEWIFKIPVDKPKKQVILKVEKAVQPTPPPKPKAKATRKKRTRSSTKKVSTED